jgi:RNA polymerase sigma-70 factor (ECF subfamily)
MRTVEPPDPDAAGTTAATTGGAPPDGGTGGAPPGGADPGGAADGAPPDGDLVARVVAGERAAFADLVRRYGALARRTAVLLGAGTDADDVVQEAFVKAYRSLGGFRAGAAFRPWLLRIVANETRNAQRSDRRRAARERSPAALPDGLLPGVAAAADPAELAVAGVRLDELWRRVRALPDPQRQVVVCRYLLDLDETETATVLGLARGTVKSRTSRALRRLRALLEEAGHG